ncbi:MAG: hypothetical protein J6U56_02100 [Spirochaetia bacterium]|nr:hypothetical protein [Spirochaetia bacterium]
MLITEEKLKEALKALYSGESYYDVDRYNNGSFHVQVSYLMDWYQAYFKDISEEERKEAGDVMKAAWRRFTPEDWDYVKKNASGVYSLMAWDRRRKKYLNQLRQNDMLDKVIGFLNS